MKTTTSYFSVLLCFALLISCKKPETLSPLPPLDPVLEIADMEFSHEIGSFGNDVNEFSFLGPSDDEMWTMATDGIYVYVGDYDNNCVKKVDLVSNTVVGWYGFENNVWGFYTGNKLTINQVFKPFRVVCRNNMLYAFSRKEGTLKTIIYKFSMSANSILDSSRVIPEDRYFTVDIDSDDRLVILKYDSIKVYNTDQSVLKFGGWGEGNGQLKNNLLSQVKFVSDTIVVVDRGNDRFQKLSKNGTFLSKFSFNSTYCCHYLCVEDNRYYIQENLTLFEYSPQGTLLKKSTFANPPSNFGVSGRQFLIVNNKVVVQDPSNHRLVVFDK